MSGRTAIEWTDTTWNPVTGCDKVSPGCDHCYAEGIARRFAGGPGFPNGFDVTLRPERLGDPLKWRKPRRVFVNSMSDLFHAAIPDRFIAQVWAIMAATPQHTYQVLTKRHGRMRTLLSSLDFDLAVAEEWTKLGTTAGSVREDHTPPYPLPNVWLGVSAENQKWADVRIPVLLDTAAACRFVSAEPLLGPIDLNAIPDARLDWPPCEDVDTGDRGGIDWLIVGGESGPGARAMHPDWARRLRDQCTTYGTAFHFKQWGEWGPAPWRFQRNADETDEQWIARCEAEAATHTLPPWAHEYDMQPQKAHPAWGGERGELAPNEPHAPLRRWGKKRAGRELDGRTWDQYPQQQPVPA